MKFNSPIHLFNGSTVHRRAIDYTTPGSTFAVVSDGRLIDTGSASAMILQVANLLAATGTDPTMDFRVEHSCDGNNWDVLIDFDQFDGTVQTKTISIPGAVDGRPKTFAQFIRILGKTGGTNPSYTQVAATLTLKG